MKKHLLVSVATLATVSAFSALAADLPSRKAPVIAPPPPLWTGFYAGLNAGYNFGTNANVYSQNWNSVSLNNSVPIALNLNKSQTQNGFIGGAQFGYNYQYGSNFVIGVETDIQGAGIRGSSYGRGAAAAAHSFGGVGIQTTSVGGTVVQAGVDYLGTIRGRLGYLATPTLLLYGTGGFAYGGAWANVAQQAVTAVSVTGIGGGEFSTFGDGHQKQLLTGWTAGGGLEWMFLPNWSLKGEALYWDLGRMNVNTVTSLPSDLGWGRTSVNYSGVQTKVGVNYHFNWGVAPVVAAY
jgi:outer membrane immunogenic protein